MEAIVIILGFAGALCLFAIMGRVSDPEPRIELPQDPDLTDEDLDAILRKHGLL